MEKKDIVRWYEDPMEQLIALKPAVPQNVNLDRIKEECILAVEDDLSVAIGRKGINARLTSDF